ncbi:MAG TPA: hypothetical protein VHS78_06375 [Candidatus Elarobacter sp.]|nr:hypothetical protein [Candidatus Elarobacter sp.]
MMSENVVLAAALAIQSSDVMHPAYVLLKALWDERFLNLASPETLLELGDRLTAASPGTFAEDFMKDYVSYCQVVVIRSRIPCAVAEVKHLLETAANGRADFIAVHEREYDKFKEAPIDKALESCGPVFVAHLRELNDVLSQLGADPEVPDDDDSPPGVISPIEAAVIRSANVDAHRRQWKDAIATKDFLSAAKAFAALLPVPELPPNFDDTGWRRAGGDSGEEEQGFECQIVARTARRSATYTVSKRFSVQTTNPEDEIVRTALYEEFVEAVRVLRLELNLIA